VLTRYYSLVVRRWVPWVCYFTPYAGLLYDLCSITGIGYLLGPVIGSQLWRATHRRTMSLIEAKDREFHQHIVKNRVDPTAQSATNPVPDFYGTRPHSLGILALTLTLWQARRLVLCAITARFVALALFIMRMFNAYQWLRDQARYKRKARWTDE
jgi:import inner membrane translocase subunit TIM23